MVKGLLILLAGDRAGDFQETPILFRDIPCQLTHRGNIVATSHEMSHPHDETSRLIESGQRNAVTGMEEIMRAGMIKATSPNQYRPADILVG